MTKMLSEIYEQPKIIQNIIENSHDIIHEVVSKIKEKTVTNVVIAARGTSDHAGIYGKYIIEHSIGIPVSLSAPSILTMYSKSINYKSSVVIGISQSGQAQDVLEVLSHAKSQGAITIGITNFNDSPIAQKCAFHLHTNAGLEKSVAATKTFTSQLAMLALLVSCWSKDDTILKLLKQVPKKIKKVLDLESDIETAVQRYTYIEDCFVLSRGINYAIALESALKIQETSYVKAKGYSISDFHHGPFAMIDEHTPVLIYAPKGPAFSDSVEMIDKLKSVGAEIILISNDQQLLEKTQVSFEIPTVQSDIITPFFNVVFAQIFACKLSLAKGCDPDAPRGLNKVTITR
jgi:glutamine---fructose-6-phosphate transaminase (isomerizing)